jgi:hypothetical protein
VSVLALHLLQSCLVDSQHCLARANGTGSTPTLGQRESAVLLFSAMLRAAGYLKITGFLDDLQATNSEAVDNRAQSRPARRAFKTC